MSKKILIGITPDFANTGVCIYQPIEDKPFKKVTSDEKFFTSSGELMDQVKYINKVLNVKRWKFSEVVVVVPKISFNTLEEWSKLKGIIQAYGKFKEQSSEKIIGRITGLADVQARFIGIASEIAEQSRSIAASKLIVGMLSGMNVPVISIQVTEEDISVFSDVNIETADLAALRAGSLVLGKNIRWAENIIEEESKAWGNRPDSYPSLANEGEFIIKRNRQ